MTNENYKKTSIRKFHKLRGVDYTYLYKIKGVPRNVQVGFADKAEDIPSGEKISFWLQKRKNLVQVVSDMNLHKCYRKTKGGRFPMEDENKSYENLLRLFGALKSASQGGLEVTVKGSGIQKGYGREKELGIKNNDPKYKNSLCAHKIEVAGFEFSTKNYFHHRKYRGIDLTLARIQSRGK